MKNIKVYFNVSAILALVLCGMVQVSFVSASQSETYAQMQERKKATLQANQQRIKADKIATVDRLKQELQQYDQQIGDLNWQIENATGSNRDRLIKERNDAVEATHRIVREISSIGL